MPRHTPLDEASAARRQADWEALDRGNLALDALRSSPRAVLGVARARVRQGSLISARDALVAAFDGTQSTGLRLVIYLELLSLRVRTELAVRAGLNDARAILATPPDGLSRAEGADAKRLEVRLIQMAATHYEESRAAAHAAEEELPQIADVLEEEGWHDEAWSARYAFAQRHHDQPEVRRQALLALMALADRSTRHDIAADAALEVARSRLESGEERERVVLALDLASERYRAAQHRVGEINVRSVKAWLVIRRERGPLTLVDAELDALSAAKDYASETALLLQLAGVAAQRGLLPAAARYRERLRELVTRTGDGMALDSLRIAVIDDLMRRADFGRAIEFCEEALSHPLPKVRQATYQQLLGTTYGLLRDPRAVPQLEQAVSMFDALGARSFASGAFAQLASRLAMTDRSEDVARARTILSDWVEHDLREGRTDDAFRNCVQLVQFELGQGQTNTADAPNLLANAKLSLARAQAIVQQTGATQATGQRAVVVALHGQLAHARGDVIELERCWTEAIAGYQSANMELEAAGLSYTLGCHELNRANDADLSTYFPRAENHLNDALSYYHRCGMREWCADARLMLAQLWANATPHVNAEAADRMLSGALTALTEAEADWDAVRSDFAAGPTLGVQGIKQSFAVRSRGVYHLAFRILNHRGEGGAIWEWAQRSKARGLADTIGLASTPPQGLVERLRETPESYARMRHEVELVERSRHADATDKPTLTRQLAKLRDEMRSDPNLAEYLALRGGKPVSRDELSALLPPGVVCVDWIGIGNRLTLVAFQRGAEPTVYPLDMGVTDAFKFVRANFGPASFRQTLREAPNILRALDLLIAPLARCSAPGDILVFSPTAPLHAVPLHALELERRPLLFRNAVSYVPSMTVLQHCLLRGRGASKAPRTAFVGDPLGDRPAAQRIASVLSTAFGASVVSGREVTRTAFGALLQGHDVFHYQGHARHDAHDALASHLPFANDEQFAARDLYELKRVPRELVTLAACETAVSAVTEGDEQLGFIPALLVSGARAVIASLWPANSGATTEIMSEFYGNLRSGSGKAKALQSAMCRVAQSASFAKPYYWAPFTLNGDWQ